MTNRESLSQMLCKGKITQREAWFLRLDYRCACAGQDDNLLIHEIAGEAAER